MNLTKEKGKLLRWFWKRLKKKNGSNVVTSTCTNCHEERTFLILESFWMWRWCQGCGMVWGPKEAHLSSEGRYRKGREKSEV